MWEHAFSPRAIMIDAAAGLAVFILFDLFRRRKPSKLEWAVAVFITMMVQQWYAGRAARAMPSGYVGQMVQACAQDQPQESCLCAVDTLKERIGEPALMRLAVRAEANLELPKEFLDAVAECRG